MTAADGGREPEGYLLTPAAEADLRLHIGAVAGDDPAEAERLLNGFAAAFEQIPKLPALGHKRPDVTDLPVLFWPLRRRWLVAYRTMAVHDAVAAVVLRLVDARRLGEA